MSISADNHSGTQITIIDFVTAIISVCAILYVDMLSIQVTPTNLQTGERATAVFIATASGVNINNFMYQWRKRGSNSLPHKVSGVNEATLIIPNLIASDGGQYHCIVTNEWGNSVESDNVILTVEGACV